MIKKQLYELKYVLWFFFFFIKNFKEGIYTVEFIVYISLSRFVFQDFLGPSQLFSTFDNNY